MSRKFCAVRPEIWIGKFFRKMDVDSKLLAIYLRTSLQFQMIGIFYIPLEIIIKHTGLTLSVVESCLKQLEKIHYLRFDLELEVVWVVDMAVSQISSGGLSQPQRKGVINELARLSEEEYPFVAEWLNLYGEKYQISHDEISFSTAWESNQTNTM